jgi:hypothetical protein
MMVTKTPKEQQGLYYYRNHRLIKFGGWQGILTSSLDSTTLVEHAIMRLAKIAIDVPANMDEEFGLEPTKTDYNPSQRFIYELSRMIHTPSYVWEIDGKHESYLGFAKIRYERKPASVKPGKKKKTKKKTTPPVRSVSVEILKRPEGDLITTTRKSGDMRVTLNKSHRMFPALKKSLELETRRTTPRVKSISVEVMKRPEDDFSGTWKKFLISTFSETGTQKIIINSSHELFPELKKRLKEIK